MLDDIGIYDARAGKWVLHQRTGHARCAHTACNAATAAPTAAGAGATAGQADAPAAAPPATAPAPLASNVLLFGGFSGDTVAGDLLQLTFMRPRGRHDVALWGWPGRRHGGVLGGLPRLLR